MTLSKLKSDQTLGNSSDTHILHSNNCAFNTQNLY